MPTKEFNKIILQTSITSLDGLYYLLLAVKNNQPMSSQDGKNSIFPQARARIANEKGGTWDEDKKDTHAELTLREMGFLRYTSEDEFEVSDLGNEFLSAFELKITEIGDSSGSIKISLEDKLPLLERNQLLYDILEHVSVKKTKYNRNIRPYIILFRLLNDSAFRGYISKSEWACFCNTSSFLYDHQYNEIRRRLLDVRRNKEKIEPQKSDRTLTKLVQWGVLENYVIGNDKTNFFSLDPNFAKVIEDNMLPGSSKKNFLTLFPELSNMSYMQKIFFGAPGTGKSHTIDYDLFRKKDGTRLKKGLSDVGTEFKFRTTFHPDYDYAQFVGCYKPRSIPINQQIDVNNPQNGNEQNNRGREERKIIYEFVPQVFAKAYVEAWEEYLKVNALRNMGIAAADDAGAEQSSPGEPGHQQPEMQQVYLVIEEINRGNCAQIFGDIFQLLDREEGHSTYPIDVDVDLTQYIKKELSKVKLDNGDVIDCWENYKTKIQTWSSENGQENVENCEEFCKIALPPNLNILATMNTSDQSLFPMDSAFKRRFDWEYVPINYDHPKAHFAIKVGNTNYDWLDFLKKINENIDEVTKSEDKKLGEFFIKPKDGKTIDLEEFRSKVLFYLWDSVYKDEEGNKDAEKVFLFNIEDGKKGKMTFQKLFDRDKGVQYVNTIMGKDHLNVDKYKENEIPVTDSLHSSETAVNTDIDTAEETTDDTAEPAQT